MYAKAEIKAIRDAYFRKGKSISAIAREQEVDRKTVRKFILQDDWNERAPEALVHSSILDPYKPLIDAWLEGDKQQRRKRRHIRIDGTMKSVIYFVRENS
jgi:hypothetical protein